MKTRHDLQWKRYSSRFGTISISRFHRTNAAFIPAHTPVISIPIDRTAAAAGLRQWRRACA